jgi:hypothetical protein
MIVVLVVLFGFHMLSAGSVLEALVALLLIAIAIVCLWLCVPLKRVQIEDETLHISNYIKSIAVPLSEIESIREIKSFSTHPIWITFKSPTDFGKKIMFMPTWCLPFTSHPIVDELWNLKKQREAGPQP